MTPPREQPDRAGTTSRASRAHNYTLAPIATTSRSAFGWTWLGMLAVWAVCWPVLTAAVINRYTDTTANFVEALYLRKDVAMGATDGMAGRIVIIGGSDALFGIDAEQLQRDLNRPVVNYATHAALRIEYLLDRAMRVLRPGDVAVLDLAYGMWGDDQGTFGEYEFAYFSSYDKLYYARMGAVRAVKALYSVPLADYPASLGRWWTYRAGKNVHWARMYDVATLGRQGDLRLKVPGSLIGAENLGPISAYEGPTAQAVRSFARWARANHIRVMYTWPPLAKATPETMAQVYATPAWLTTLFDRESITMLDRPEDNFFPIAWFYDTDKHLNSSGRRVHTEALGRRLSEALGKTAAPPQGLFLLGCPDAGLLPLADLPDTPVTYRYLADRQAHRPEQVTPQEVRQLIRAGQAVLYDDLDVEPLLAMQGLQGRQVMGRRATLAEFLRPYDQHLILVTRNTPEPWTEQATAALPGVLASALRSNGVFALAIGTGPYSTVARQVGAHGHLPRRISPLVGNIGPRLDLDVRVDALRINGQDIAPARHGVRVAVIDPRAGVLVNAAAFVAPTTAVQVNQRYQVLPMDDLPPGERCVLQELPLDRLAAVGSHPPQVQRHENGVTLLPTGDDGNWGLPVHSGEDAANGGLVLEVLAPPGAQYRVELLTNRPELFWYLPDRRVFRGDGAARQVGVRWKLRERATFGPDDYAFAVVGVDNGTAPVSVRRVWLVGFPR